MDSAVGASFVGVCVSVAGCVPGDRVVSVSTFVWFVNFEGSRMLKFLKSLKNSLSDDPVHRAAATLQRHERRDVLLDEPRGLPSAVC